MFSKVELELGIIKAAPIKLIRKNRFTRPDKCDEDRQGDILEQWFKTGVPRHTRVP